MLKHPWRGGAYLLPGRVLEHVAGLLWELAIVFDAIEERAPPPTGNTTTPYRGRWRDAAELLRLAAELVRGRAAARVRESDPSRPHDPRDRSQVNRERRSGSARRLTSDRRRS